MRKYESVQIADEYNEMAEKAFDEALKAMYELQWYIVDNVKPKLEMAEYFTYDRSGELFNRVVDNMVVTEKKWHKKHAAMLKDVYQQMYELYIPVAASGVALDKLQNKILKMFNAFLEGD